MNSKIFVIVAHSDDETLGLGGTINRHFLAGDKVYVQSMTDGVSSRFDKNLEKIKERLNAANKAAKTLGFEWLESGQFPDNSMDSISILDVVKFIEKSKSLLNPDIIYTHSGVDLNIDHKIVNQAAITAFRPQPNEKWTEIRLFETPSSTEWGINNLNQYFQPNLWVNIKNNWLCKLEALKKYHLEMRNYPHSRSFEAVENLAKYRGNQVGLHYAESFQVIKKIVR